MLSNCETGYSSLCRMNSILIYTLLGLTTSIVQPARPKGSPKANLLAWPPGSNIYLGESVALRCTCSVARGTRFVWTYHWFKHKPHAALIPNPGHLVSGDSYSITVVTREDGGSYWCQAEGKGNNSTMLLLSDPATLTVSEVSPPLLTVTPSTRQLFPGRQFTVQCPMSERNSTGWILRQLSGDFKVRATDLKSGLCSPLGGVDSEEIPDGCVFPNTNSGNSGLYWCECPEGRRSNAVNITVSYGDMIIMSPAHAVSEGDSVVLYCEYRNGTSSKTILIKDGVEVQSSYSLKSIIEMPIDNATSAEEGFYKCTSPDREMESPESWLSVRSNSTSVGRMTVSNDSTGKWIVLSCCIVGLLFSLPLIGWLVHRYRHRIWCTRSCWPLAKEGPTHVDPPKTKQDVTEVQWDLPWMEMSNLLDKQVYSGS